MAKVKEELEIFGDYFDPNGIGSGLYINLTAAVNIAIGDCVTAGQTLGELILTNTNNGIMPIGVATNNAIPGENVKVCISGIAKVSVLKATIGKSLLLFNSAGKAADIDLVLSDLINNNSNSIDTDINPEFNINLSSTLYRRGVIGLSYQTVRQSITPSLVWAQISPSLVTGFSNIKLTINQP